MKFLEMMSKQSLEPHMNCVTHCYMLDAIGRLKLRHPMDMGWPGIANAGGAGYAHG
ncbi:MAG: hypothetical protein Q7T78_16240 [Rhodoferax sp.]|nr:hypothetical protein [Rhodoferax sp.]